MHKSATYQRNQFVEALEFSNNNKKLLNRFLLLLKLEYGYKRRVTGIWTARKVVMKKKSVMKDLLRFSDYGHTRWRVPVAVANGTKKIKYAFLRGIFDGDGNITNSRIRLYSTNLAGLLEVGNLLRSIDIAYRFEGPFRIPKRKDFYDIIIQKKEAVSKYITLVGSNKNCRGVRRFPQFVGSKAESG